MNEEYYTLTEVAEILKVYRRTVYNWVRKNQIRNIRIGKLYRIPKDAVREYIDSHSV